MALAYELNDRNRLEQMRQRIVEATDAYQREVEAQQFRETQRRDEVTAFRALDEKATRKFAQDAQTDC